MDFDIANARPLWSVMIPVYNPPLPPLKQALESVLAQAAVPGGMQIEIIDDCSPTRLDLEWVRSIAGDRVNVYRESSNLGLAGVWNRCIERANGHLVHILHQDDYVLPGFYARVAEVAHENPTIALIATRSFFVDEDNIIVGTSPRLRALEQAGTNAAELFYTTPIQCPAIVLRKRFYQKSDGFRSDLKFSIDREMWARAISTDGGIVVPQVLACYRMSPGNESARLYRTGEALADLETLNRLFKERYPSFEMKRAQSLLADLAYLKFEEFSRSGDTAAAEVNLLYWRKNAPIFKRMRRWLIKEIRHFMRN